MRRVYLDNNATTPIHPYVRAAIAPFIAEHFGNPSSLHWAGREVRDDFRRARDRIAAVLKAKPHEIVITSCGTEADNHAIKGVAFSRRDQGNHIITTRVEHPAVLNCCAYLEQRGFEVTYLPVDSFGIVDPEDVQRAMRKETVLVSIMYGNNETGTLMPLKEIGEIARHAGVLLHSDMVQTLGKTEIDVTALNVDLASFSGHKVYAPKGVGALYVREGIELDNLLHGGHQEGGRRGGTENVVGAVALGAACEIVNREMAREVQEIEDLRRRLLEGIFNAVGHVRLNGHPERRLPNTLNLSFDFVEAESLLLALDMEGIAVSAGSACSSGSGEPSHVLLSMGIPPASCQSAVRISLGRENTVEDVEYTLSVIPRVVERLRKMSPFYKG